jgi:hypothetical protein
VCPSYNAAGVIESVWIQRPWHGETAAIVFARFF